MFELTVRCWKCLQVYPTILRTKTERMSDDVWKVKCEHCEAEFLIEVKR